MRLIAKYNRIVIPVLLGLLVISFFASYFIIRQILQNELDGVLVRTKKRVEIYIRKNNRIPDVSSFNDQQIQFETATDSLPYPRFSDSRLFIPEQNKQHLSRKLVFTIPFNRQYLKVSISEPLEGTRHLTLALVQITGLSLAIILLFIAIINRFTLSRTWSPFYQALENMKSFRVHSPAKLAFAKSGIEEFDLMTNHFSQAAQNASKEYRLLKEFSENASHEIQTPLAIIRSKLDLLIQQDHMTEQMSEISASMYSAVSRISKLNQSLLLTTKIENKQFVTTSPINLTERLGFKLSQFHELWEQKHIKLATDFSEATITANPELVEILLDNLLSNATRYNQSGGWIRLRTAQTQLEIANTATGQALDPDRIFQRFYKATQEPGATGLGLSIVKQICDSSGISIHYQFDDGWHLFRLHWN